MCDVELRRMLTRIRHRMQTGRVSLLTDVSSPGDLFFLFYQSYADNYHPFYIKIDSPYMTVSGCVQYCVWYALKDVGRRHLIFMNESCYSGSFVLSSCSYLWHTNRNIRAQRVRWMTVSGSDVLIWTDQFTESSWGWQETMCSDSSMVKVVLLLFVSELFTSQVTSALDAL